MADDRPITRSCSTRVRAREASHFLGTYMSALPNREANCSQNADRSDSVLKIEHRVVYPRVVAADEEAAPQENEHG